MSQKNYYKQFWRNVKANSNLPILETLEHWIWKTRVGRGIKDFNVNANNEIKAALTKPLGPPIEVFDQVCDRVFNSSTLVDVEGDG